MLSEWQKQIDKFIPEDLPGYNFVCRIPVFIPVQEISLTVWERKIQTLPFIHECILSAISISAKSLSDLAEQFGIPESIMIQIISQLDTDRLAAVSAGNIILTAAGEKALQTQQKVKTSQQQFGHIFFNQITGDISDIPFLGTYREPPFGQVYLREKFPVTLDFLRSRFDVLATIYHENRSINSAFRTNLVEDAELYRILDISNQALSYIRDFCFVYISQEDKSLAFRFQSGIHAYAEALLEQIKLREPGAGNLLSQKKRLCGVVQTGNQIPIQLVEALAIQGNQHERLAALEEAYYSNRPLLDGEVENILSNCFTFKPERILVEAPYIGEFLTDTAIPALFSPQTKEIIIHYSSDDRQAERILAKVRKQFKNKKGCKLITQALSSVSGVKLYFGDMCAIKGQYRAHETIYKREIYKLCAHITFDSEQINLLWKNIDI